MIHNRLIMEFNRQAAIDIVTTKIKIVYKVYVKQHVKRM